MNNLNSTKLIVNSSLLIVHRKIKKTTNYEPFTLSSTNGPTIIKRQRRSGFTLIELLVTMSIIVILATAGTYMYGIVKSKARDVKRKQDIKALQTALFLYSRNNNNIYPICISAQNLPLNFSTNACELHNTPFVSWLYRDLTPYINKIPYDPGQTSTTDSSGGLVTGYRYYGIDIAGTAYTCNQNWLGACPNFGITACLENVNDQEQDSVNVCDSGTASYTLHAPN